MSVIGSGAECAVAYQEEHGWADLVLFDCVMFKGSDISMLPLLDRRRYAAQIEYTAHLYNVEYSVMPYGGIMKAAEAYIKEGLEGAVLKNPSATYFQSKAWLKYKKAFTIDGLVTGFVPGKGKHTGQVGALKVSVINFETQKVQEICSVAPGTDNERREWGEYFEELECGYNGRAYC